MERRIPHGGVRTWAAPDPSTTEGEPIAGGVDVEVVMLRDDGWAHVRSPDGREVWINGTVLVEPASRAVGAPTGRRRMLWVAVTVLLLGAGAVAAYLALRTDSVGPDAAPASSTSVPAVLATSAPLVTTGATSPVVAATTVPPASSVPVTTLPPAIDPTIGWRWTDPAQFAEVGNQRALDVVSFDGVLVAAGVSQTYEPVARSVALPNGGSVSLRDWRITVTAAQLDAAAAIAALDPANEPAPDGVRYVLVELEVTNLGDGDFRNVWSDVEMFLATPDGMPLSRGAYCASTLPDRLRGGPFDAGEMASGTACFALLDERVRDDMVVGFTPSEAERGQTDAVAWTSTDGETWDRVDAPVLGGPGDQAITHLVVVDGTVYAGGTTDGDIAIWRSADGRAWERLETPALGGPGEQVLFDLVADDGVLLAAGASTPPLAPGEDTAAWEPDFHDFLARDVHSQAALWRSVDGAGWDRVDLGSAGRTLASAEKIAVHEGRTALIGHHIDGEVAVLASADVTEWGPAPLAPADTRWWAPTAAATIGDRLHVLGAPAALSTADGETWELGPVVRVDDAVAGGDALLGVGRSGGITVVGPINVDTSRPALSVIHDDGTWSSVTSAALVPDGTVGGLQAVTPFGDRYVAVGWVSGDGDDAGAWIGGAAEGTATAEFAHYEPIVADPPPFAPASPTADLVHFDGTAWNVVDLGDGLPDDVADDLDAFELFSRFLARDGEGALWEASRSGGVHRLDAGGWTRFDRADGLPSVQITDLETDLAGTVWVGTAAGPAFYDGERWRAPNLPAAIAHPHVTELAVAPDGTVWAACLGGLAGWDGSAWTVFTRTDGLPSSVVSDVLPGLDGVWVVTPAGLGHWDGTVWSTFTEAAHRPDFEAYPYVSPLDTAIYFAPGVEPGASDYRTELIRLAPDGTASALVRTSTYTATALTAEGTLYVGTDINGLYVIGAGVDNVGSIEGVRLLHIGELWSAPNGEVWMDAGQGLFQIHSVGLVTRHTDIPGLGYQLVAPDEGFGGGGTADLVFGRDGQLWALMNPQLPEW